MSTILLRHYDPQKKRSIMVPTKLIGSLKPRIVRINIGENRTTLKMAPSWFKYNDYSEVLTNLVYPVGIRDIRPFDTIACYRAATRQRDSNFRRKPLSGAEDDPETVILALDQFAKSYDGELSFSKQEFTFSNAAENTACGVANLSSIHLLVTNYISSATFQFLVDVNYEKDLACSCESMQDFVLTFSSAVAKILSCSNDYVRVLSIEKVPKKRGEAIVKFGITTPDRATTEQLAQQLQEHGRIGFKHNHVLNIVKSDEYDYQWESLISFLQLCPADLNREYNIDYRHDDFPGVLRYGGYPYYLPLGWYYHGLKLDNKYSDGARWLICDDVEGAWPVAFHGTKQFGVASVVDKGFQRSTTQRDALLKAAIRQQRPTVERPAIFVATDCNRGASIYTQELEVKVSAEETKTLIVVFQCRVRPNSFSVHKTPVYIGEAWRIVDGEAVRPYGILIRSVPMLNT